MSLEDLVPVRLALVACAVAMTIACDPGHCDDAGPCDGCPDASANRDAGPSACADACGTPGCPTCEAHCMGLSDPCADRQCAAYCVDGSAPDAGAGDAGPMVVGDAGAPDAGAPVGWVFEEVDGLVAFEAEHFTSNDANGTPRAFYLTSATEIPMVTPDPDPPHFAGASGGTYLEGLPDTRVTHSDPIVIGESFYTRGGEGPILSYRVVFHTTGRYYVHARAFSTGTEDNGVHVGIDGTWPSSGERIQWCRGSGSWTWSSAQRDSGGAGSCGVEHTIWIDVPSPGEHLIELSMREDGFELDKVILTTDGSYAPSGTGPAERAVGR